MAHPSSDFSQGPSLHDQRRISTTEPSIGVDVKAELSAPPPDAAPQPAPVDPTTLVPSAKSFELMRQLEALAHEVAVVSRRDSSDQCITVQDGSKLSAGLQLVEPSIRVSPHDHLASDSPSFVAVALVWQSQRVSTANSPINSEDVAGAVDTGA